jgi:hypothetical protein
MNCKICGKSTNRAVRITTAESKTELQIYCCEGCRELLLEELKRRQPAVIVNPPKTP